MRNWKYNSEMNYIMAFGRPHGEFSDNVDIDDPFGAVALLMWVNAYYGALDACRVASYDDKWTAEFHAVGEKPKNLWEQPYDITIRLKGGELVRFQGLVSP